MTATGLEFTTSLFINEHSAIYPNWPNDSAMLWVLICTLHLTVFSYHVTYAFQSDFIFNTCLNMKETLARSRCEIWSWVDCLPTWTCNHLVDNRTLMLLAQVARWLSFFVVTYLYGAFYCMFLSCHVRVSEWIHTLYLSQCQGTPRWKPALNFNFNKLQPRSLQPATT